MKSSLRLLEGVDAEGHSGSFISQTAQSDDLVQTQLPIDAQSGPEPEGLSCLLTVGSLLKRDSKRKKRTILESTRINIKSRTTILDGGLKQGLLVKVLSNINQVFMSTNSLESDGLSRERRIL
jgi:hypothetical protein